MRPSLLPGLLAAARRNADRGFGDIGLFEVGQVFLGDRDTDQRFAAAGLRAGTAGLAGAGRHWRSPAPAVNVFDAKADALAVLAALAIPLGGLQTVPGGPAFLHPGRSATLRLGPKAAVGFFGELHPKVMDAMGIAGPLAVFEIILDALPLPKSRPTRAKPRLERVDLMPVERDFAFVVDEAVAAADILKAVRAVDRAVIAEAGVFDVYRGAGIGEGRKSVAVSVTLQPRDRTLTDAELDALGARIEAEVARKTGAVLRR